MSQLTAREIMLRTIHHQSCDKVPFTIGFESDVYEKLCQHYGSTEWAKDLNPYMAYVAQADTILYQSDNGHEKVDAYGNIWRTDRKLWHIEPLLNDSSLEGYTFPDYNVFIKPIHDRMDEFLQNCKNNPDKFRVISMGWGLFERAWMLRGFENLLVDMIAEPDFVHELLRHICDIYLEMVRACKSIPADGFLFGDDWGDQRGVIIGAARWREIIKPYWKRIYDEVHAQGKIVMSHSCGSIHDILPDLIEIGLDVYESVQPEPQDMNPYVLKQKFGDKITFWGCLGTQSTIVFGTPDEIRNEIEHLKREMSVDGGYILAPTKPLQTDTPMENAFAIIEAFKACL